MLLKIKLSGHKFEPAHHFQTSQLLDLDKMSFFCQML